MQLKSQQQIDVAIDKHRDKVSPDRAKILVATIGATRPEKRDELDAIFSEGLNPEELAFYHDIVEGAPLSGAAITSHAEE